MGFIRRIEHDLEQIDGVPPVCTAGSQCMINGCDPKITVQPVAGSSRQHQQMLAIKTHMVDRLCNRAIPATDGYSVCVPSPP